MVENKAEKMDEEQKDEKDKSRNIGDQIMLPTGGEGNMWSLND
jgi:hypothetical protein